MNTPLGLTLIRSLVVRSVDYCNPVLAGVSGQLLDRLQSVLNTAARLIFSVRKSEHITPLLSELDQVRQLLRSPLHVLLNYMIHAFTVVIGPARPTSDDVVTQQ